MADTADQNSRNPPEGPDRPRSEAPSEPNSSRIVKLWWIVAAALLLAAIVAAIVVIQLNQPAKATRIGSVATGVTGFLTRIVRDEKLVAEKDMIDWVDYSGPDQLNQGLANGDIQVNVGASAPAIAVQVERRRPVRYISTLLLNTNAIVAKQDLSLPAEGDLSQLKLGWFGQNTGGGIGLYSTVERSRDGQFRQLQLRQYLPPQLPAALARGEVDAILTFEPFVTKLLASGQRKIIYGPLTDVWFRETGQPLELAGIAVNQTWLQENSELAGRIDAAYREAIRNVIAAPEVYIRRYAKVLNLTTEAEIQLGLVRIPATLAVQRQSELNKSIVGVMDVMAQDKFILSSVPYHVLAPNTDE